MGGGGKWNGRLVVSGTAIGWLVGVSLSNCFFRRCLPFLSSSVSNPNFFPEAPFLFRRSYRHVRGL